MDKKEKIVKEVVHKAIEKIEEFAEKLTKIKFQQLVEQVKGLVDLVKKILQMAIKLLPKLGDHVKLYAGHVVTMLGLVAVADMVLNTAKYVVLGFYLKMAARNRPELADIVADIDINLDNVSKSLDDANEGFDKLVEETKSLCDPNEPTDDDKDQLKSLRDGIADPGKGLYHCFGDLRKSKGMLESTIVKLGKAEVFQDSVVIHLLGISKKNKDGVELNEVQLNFLKEPGAARQKIVGFFSFFGKVRSLGKKKEDS